MKIKKEQYHEIVKMYKSGLSTIKIGKEFGVCHKTVLEILKKKDLPRRTIAEANTIYNVNGEFFSDINTEEKAYWLGFFAADGYLEDNNNTVTISLCMKDISHLYELNKALSSSYPVNSYSYKSTKFCRLYIKNKCLRNALWHYMDNHKTFTLKYPAISHDLDRHFIRGYFDGNGYISKDRTPQIDITGNRFIIGSIKEILISKLDLSNTKNRIRHKETPDIHTLRYGGMFIVYKIYLYFYKDSTVFLKRKHDIFLNWFSTKPSKLFLNRLTKEMNKNEIDCFKNKLIAADDYPYLNKKVA